MNWILCTYFSHFKNASSSVGLHVNFHDGVLPDHVSPCLAKETLAHLHFIYAQDKSFIVTELRTQALSLMGRETGNLSLLNHLPQPDN